MSQPTSLCPCSSEQNYESCCGRFLDGGQLAPNAEALMRSRYTAFCRGAFDYLRLTWHPESCPDDLGAEEPSNWVHLEVIEFDEDGDEAEVEFKASLIFDNKLEILHERSFFEKFEGRWVYHSGEFLDDGQRLKKIAKDAPCPCLSGKIFKNCHWQAP